MTSILLDHHNKLGDHLSMNGAVREHARRYDRVGIFCQPQYYKSVSCMFRDLPNLTIERAATHRQKQYFRWRNRFFLTPHHYKEVRILYDDLESGVISELQWYKRAGVDHEKKWESFYVARDKEREQNFLERFVVRESYLFVHDDPRYPLNRANIHSALPICSPKPSLTNNIFDYCLAIERATEIHVVDSAFLFLTDLLPYENPAQKLFVHRYARHNLGWNLPILKKPWHILT